MQDSLYRYTSIESLALILKNRTLRFARLDTVDDPQECRTLDSRNAALMRYVSCWTANAQESIPMWREYAGVDCGIRIEMPRDPFARYCWNVDIVTSVTGMRCEADGDNPSPFEKMLIPFEELWDRGLLVLEFGGESNILHKVEYTNDTNLLFPKTLGLSENGDLSVNHNAIGLHKAMSWAYQNEWRYILTILPIDVKGSAFEQDRELPKLGAFLTDRGGAHTPSYYDMKIADGAFRSMKLTVSPKMSPGNRVLLESLIEKYNPDAELFSSCIEL